MKQRPHLPLTIAATLCGIALLTACGADAGSQASAEPRTTAQPTVDNGATGIVLADPSADPGAAAKRRAPEAVGSVESVTFGEDSVQVVFQPDAGYEYFEGTTFDIPFSAVAAIDGETPVVLGDLKQGDRINVWTSACAESFPVQCTVEAVTAAY